MDWFRIKVRRSWSSQGGCDKQSSMQEMRTSGGNSRLRRTAATKNSAKSECAISIIQHESQVRLVPRSSVQPSGRPQKLILHNHTGAFHVPRPGAVERAGSAKCPPVVVGKIEDLRRRLYRRETGFSKKLG